MTEKPAPIVVEDAAKALPAALQGDTEVAALAANAVPLLAAAKALEIDSPEADAQAKEMLATIAADVKHAESLRKRWTKPLLDAKRGIDGDFNRITEPAKSAERILREKVANYYLARQQEARKVAQAAAEAAGMEVIAAPQAKTETEAGSVSMRNVWTFTVVDPSKVPHQYLAVNEAAIREAVKAGVRVIPGVDIHEDAQVVVNRGR